MLLFRAAALAGCLLFTARELRADERTDAQLLQWKFTTPAYEDAAVQVLLKEVNDVATQMQLAEALPIRREDLVATYIGAPYWSDHGGAFGSISTRKYHYFASADNKLSQIVRNLGKEDTDEPAYMGSLKRRLIAPKSQMDTNAAHLIATQWLAAAGVDVKALESSCRVRIRAWELGEKFVPVYWIVWAEPCSAAEQSPLPHDDRFQTVASMQMVEPEHRLLQLHVEKPQYLTRKPLAVPDRDQLLQQTEDPGMRQVWVTTEAYRHAVVALMLEEVNRACQEMRLPEKLPVRQSNLTRVVVETPYFSDRLGHFAMVATENYVYAATASNKLSSIVATLGFQEKAAYMNWIKNRYAAPKSQINTNAAYALAARWMELASIDVRALTKDCRLTVRPWEIGDKFVPLYELRWRTGKDGPGETAALVRVLEPEGSLHELTVEKSEYIKRAPLAVPGREKLLRETSAASLPKTTLR